MNQERPRRSSDPVFARDMFPVPFPLSPDVHLHPSLSYLPFGFGVAAQCKYGEFSPKICDW